MIATRWMKSAVSSARLFCDAAGASSSKLPQHMTTPADRFWLRITKTLPAEKIGTEVSLTIMEKAINRRRVGINIGMCVVSLFISITVIKKMQKNRKEDIRKLLEN